MKKTLKIGNMTCEHCVMRVEEALKEIEGVDEVKVSLFRKQAKVTGENLDEQILKNAVEEVGFDVKKIS